MKARLTVEKYQALSTGAEGGQDGLEKSGEHEWNPAKHIGSKGVLCDAWKVRFPHAWHVVG
jgi:hypothetical protein